MACDLAVVIPVFNDAGGLDEFYTELASALSTEPSYELIFVDDGSTDDSVERLHAIQSGNPRVTAIRLGRHSGQQAALAFGLDHATSDIVVLFDSDLQFDPRDILRLVSLVKAGHDLANGRRERISDVGPVRRLASALAGWTVRRVTRVSLNDPTSPFKAFRAALLRGGAPSDPRSMFPTAMALARADSIVEIAVVHRPRRFGRSKYSLLRLVHLYLTFLAVFCPRLPYIVGIVTATVAFFGFGSRTRGGGVLGLVAVAGFLSVLWLLHSVPRPTPRSATRESVSRPQ